jgi:hypothetical protein
MQAEIFGENWAAMDLPFPCEIHACWPRASKLPDARRVLALFTEPKKGMIENEWVRDNFQLFNLIATYDRTLADLPNVKIIDFGGAHCNFPPRTKDFSISFILSTGCNEPEYKGYDIRRDIAMNFGFLSVPGRLFFSSKRMILKTEQIDSIIENQKLKNYSAMMLGDSKAIVFQSMFHVAVENNMDEYYFTEKLIDCFRTYTIPIYWGTHRVLDIFDNDGIIYAKDNTKLHSIVSSLTPHDYWCRMAAMARNYTLSESYLDPVGRLKRLILASLPWAI